MMVLIGVVLFASSVAFGMWASGGTLPPPGIPSAKRCPHCKKVIDDGPKYGGGPG
jgi:hypothetical protein